MQSSNDSDSQKLLDGSLPDQQKDSVRLRGIFAGKVAPLGPGNVPSAFIKKPVAGEVKLAALGIDGDEQADRRVHGGADMAVYAYPYRHYELWRAEFPQHEAIWAEGSLGENFSIDGWDERDVCVGDIIKVGNVLLQVTRPRKPCFKLALRFNDLRLPRRMTEAGRCGWYFRVLRDGVVSCSDAPELVQRHHPDWSIRRVNDISIQADPDLSALEELASLPELEKIWCSQVNAVIKSKQAANASRSFRAFKVLDRISESQRIATFQLGPIDGNAVAPSLPGQHVVVRVTPESGKQELRCYSISAPTTPDQLQISIKKEGNGGVSDHFHDNVAAGDKIELMGPRGSFVLRTDSDLPLVLISAGVGITPMIPMLTVATTNNGGRIVPRSSVFLHVARNSLEHAFAKQTSDIASRHPTVSRHIRFSQPLATDLIGKTHDSVGRIDIEIIDKLMRPLGECNVFICGPAQFMADVKAMIAELGLPAHVKIESFETASPSAEGKNSAQPSSAKIILSKSGRSAEWKPGVSLLTLLEEQGVAVERDCQMGLCGVCTTRVVSGRVGYEVEPVAPLAPDEMLVCCGFPIEDELVLDL